MKDKKEMRKELNKLKENYEKNKDKQEQKQLRNIEKNVKDIKKHNQKKNNKNYSKKNDNKNIKYNKITNDNIKKTNVKVKIESAKSIEKNNKEIIKNEITKKEVKKLKENINEKDVRVKHTQKNINNIIVEQEKILSKNKNSKVIEPVKEKKNAKKELDNKNKIKKRRKTKTLILIITIILILLTLSICFMHFTKVAKEREKERIRQENIRKEQELINEISSHYNEYVKTNKESILYNENGEEIGKIANNVELSLEDITIEKDTKYFKIKEFENHYIKYDDVDTTEALSSFDSRYKRYIVFNQNIVTNNITTFYDSQDNMVYQFNKSFDLPIIIKDNDRYGLEYNNRLLYVKKDDVASIKDNINTNQEKASSIRIIAYHAFYDKNVAEEAWCRTSICHSTDQIEAHSKYISENNYFTLTMDELEMYIDGKINIPKKSVGITIDDGLLAEHGIDILSKYKLNATVFLITHYYKPSYYIENEYIEFHSHGHNIHNVGQCPGGQGGGVKCLEENLLQNDLKTSREILNGSTVFCYPFYEYNNYAIKMLKEAGFTMAFAGLINDGRAHVGTNKYLVPRYTITSDTTVNELANIIK